MPSAFGPTCRRVWTPGALLQRGVRGRGSGGLGLGPSISRELIEREGGSLVLANAVGLPGCVARVTLPRWQDALVPRSSDREAPPMHRE